MISEERMRSEFEQSNCYTGSMRLFGCIAERYGLEDGDYHDSKDRTSWSAWKASRESLVESGNNKMYTESPEGGQP